MTKKWTFWVILQTWKKRGGNEEDFSFGIYGTISVSKTDRFRESFGGDAVLSDKSPIDAGDVGSGVYLSVCVDDSKGLFIW